MRPFVLVGMACIFGVAAIVFGTRTGVSALFIIVLAGAIVSLAGVGACGITRGHCSRCRQVNRIGSRFCARCGHAL